MGQFTVYLVKDSHTHQPRYIRRGSSVVENKQSIFAEGVTTDASVMVEQYIAEHHQKRKLVVRSSGNTDAYFRQTASGRTPWWAEFWNVREKIAIQSADLLLVRPVAGHVLLLTHGQGRHLVNPHALVHDFGLRSSLNMIDPEQIKSTDMFTPSEVGMSTRKQAGKSTRIGEYGIDVFQTLLKAVSGKCRAKFKDLFNSIHGTDSFKFSFSGTRAGLDNILEVLLSCYDSEEYKSAGFGWIDNFRQVKDPELIGELQSDLQAAVNARDARLVLTFPERFDVPLDAYFSYRRVSRAHSDSLFPTLEIENYFGLLDELGEPTTMADLRRQQITMVDGDTKQDVVSYNVYNCIYFESKRKGRDYFLESGVWYRVSPSFLKDINERLKQMLEEPVDLGFPFRANSVAIQARNTKQNKERVYNQQLTEHLKAQGKAALLDSCLITVNRSKIEICDVLFRNDGNQTFLVHNKVKYGASALSHLFSQGLVSLETLLDPDCRRKANALIVEPDLRFPDSIERGAPLVVVYGIIAPHDASGRSHLPLFSLINLEHFAGTIKRLGFTARLSYIDLVRN